MRSPRHTPTRTQNSITLTHTQSALSQCSHARESATPPPRALELTGKGANANAPARPLLLAQIYSWLPRRSLLNQQTPAASR